MVAPGIGAAIGATGGFFPFGFGGQAAARPGTIGLGLPPVDPDNGIVGVWGVVKVFRAGGRTKAGRFGAGLGGHAGLILGISDFGLVNPKGGDRNGVLGFFVAEGLEVGVG